MSNLSLIVSNLEHDMKNFFLILIHFRQTEKSHVVEILGITTNKALNTKKALKIYVAVPSTSFALKNKSKVLRFK